MKKISLSLLSILFTSTAMAQTIDYNGLGDLFGESVTTSATGKPQRTSEAPVSIDIISKDEIKQSGAKDIPELLRRIPGINVNRVDSQTVDIGVRGYNHFFNQNLLVLVNGRQVYLDTYGMTVWSALPVQIDEIQQIEVVRGPNTALFGFNAAAGVVNIVTKSPLYDNQNSASVSLGTDGTRRVSVVKTLKLLDGGIRFSAGASEADKFKAKGRTNLTDNHRDPQKFNLSADGLFQLDDTTQVGFEATHSNVDQSETLGIGRLYDSSYRTSSAKLHFAKNVGTDVFSGQVYRNWVNLNYADLGKTKNEVTVAQLAYLADLGDGHTLRLAGEYRYNESPTFPQKTGKMTYDVWSVSGMWNWQATNELAFTAASRVDFMDSERTGTLPAGAPFSLSDYDKDTYFSYNLGAVWKATDVDTFRISTARGLSTPSLIDSSFTLTFVNPTTVAPGVTIPLMAGVYGTPYLKANKITSYEIGYSRDVDFIDGSVGVTGFYQEVKNIRTTNVGTIPDWFSLTDPVQIGFLFKNVGNSKGHGIEVEAEGKFNEKFGWKLAYTWVDVNDNLNVNQMGYFYPVGYEDQAPRNTLSGELTWTDKVWWTKAGLYYVDQTSDYRLVNGNFVGVDLSDYLITNVSAGYQVNENFDLTLDILNAQAQRTSVSVYPKQERRAIVTARYQF